MFGTLFTIAVGVAIGYFFKPQIDDILVKTVKKIRDNRKSHDDF
jgi:hypothetical protein